MSGTPGNPTQLDTIVVYAPRQLPDGSSLSAGHNYDVEGVYLEHYDANDKLLNKRDFSYEDYEKYRRENPDLDLPEIKKPKKRAPGTNGNGNTVGRVVGESGTSGKPASEANPEVEAETAAEDETGNKILDGVQLGLDVVGLIPVVGEVADIGNGIISLFRGDFVGAGLSFASAIPFAGYAASGAKAVRKGTKLAAAATEGAAKTVKHAPKPKPKTSNRGGGKKGGKAKGKRKMKCGEYGRYGDLKKKTGDGKFDRDHIPSKEALKKRARALNKGNKLSADQLKAIEDWGGSIAIPRKAHSDISPTYGGRNANLSGPDANDLAGAARRDVEAMLKEIDKYDKDGGCKKAYQKAAKRVLRMNNSEFDQALKKIIDSVD